MENFDQNQDFWKISTKIEMFQNFEKIKIFQMFDQNQSSQKFRPKTRFFENFDQNGEF